MAVLRLHVAILVALLLNVHGLISAPACTGAGCPLRRLAFPRPLVASFALAPQSGLRGSRMVTVLPAAWSGRSGRASPLTLRATQLDAGLSDMPADGKNAKKDKKSKKSRAERKAASTKALEVHVVGLSHHHAGVEVREKLAVPEANWNHASQDICAFGTQGVHEAAVLSTCNRFEVYVAAPDARTAMYDVSKYLSERSSIPVAELRESLFMLSGEEAVWHLLRVSGGLDSLVVGEGQILAQVKACYERGTALPVEAAEDREEVVGGSAGKVVSKLLNTAVAAGKRVRSETNISKGAVSISSAAAEFSASRSVQDVGSTLAESNLCIVGAGKMSRLLLTHLKSAGIKKVAMINRSMPRMEALAAEYPELEISKFLMEDLWKVVKENDIVFTSTASEDAFVTKEALLDNAVGGDKPVMFVDISVPRNVEMNCNEVDGVFAYNVDDLKAVVARNTALRQREVQEAEILLQEEMAKYRSWQSSLGAIPAINALQDKAEAFRAEELKKVAGKLDKLSTKEREAVERLSRGIVNKLLHGPMSTVRAAEGPEDKRRTLSTLNKMFNLEK